MKRMAIIPHLLSDRRARLKTYYAAERGSVTDRCHGREIAILHFHARIWCTPHRLKEKGERCFLAENPNLKTYPRFGARARHP